MKNILICVSGLTPQIITSTLYCLNKYKNIVIDEIYVVTTSKGRDIILGIDKEYKYPELKIQIKEMCEKFGFRIPKFTVHKNLIVAEEESVEIPDMRSTEANIIFPNVLCILVKELAANIHSRLYCSISGGRKSMGVYLALAISLFGKESDKLIHVLTTPKNEKAKLPYPQTKKQEKEFDLTEIPFVKLRKLINDFIRKEEEIKIIRERKLNYSDIVELTQDRLGIDKLTLNKNNNHIYFGDNPSVRLEPRLFEFYMRLIQVKHTGKDTININELSKGKTKEELMLSRGNILSLITKLNEKIKKTINDNDKSAPYIIHTPKVWGTGNYGIPADLNMFEIIE